MTRDRVYLEELAHDSGPSAEPFLKDALDSIVDDLMAGRNFPWFNPQEFLYDQRDLAELAWAAIISGDFETFKDMIEGRLRRELEDHDAVHDLAAQMAAGDDE